jgi:hypothetical protein
MADDTPGKAFGDRVVFWAEVSVGSVTLREDRRTREKGILQTDKRNDHVVSMFSEVE